MPLSLRVTNIIQINLTGSYLKIFIISHLVNEAKICNKSYFDYNFTLDYTQLLSVIVKAELSIHNCFANIRKCAHHYSEDRSRN